MAALENDAKPAAGTERPPMDAHEYQELIASVTRGFMKDPDKLKKFQAAASQNTFTSAQVKGLCEATRGCWCDTAVTLYPSISDKDKFDDVLKVFKWEEERDEVKQRLKLK